MSDIMLLGVLRMPPNCWDHTSEMDVMQRHSRYIEAADRIDSDGLELQRLRTKLEQIRAEAEDTDSGISECIQLDRILLMAEEALNPATKDEPK